MKRVPISVRRRSGFCPAEHRGTPQIFGMVKVMEDIKRVDAFAGKRSKWRMGVTMEPGSGNLCPLLGVTTDSGTKPAG